MNTFEEVVYQMPVAGYENLTGRVFSGYEFHGPFWLTGGEAGMIGSVPFLVAALILMIVTLWRAIATDRFGFGERG